MNYAEIKKNDIANGEGVRTSLFVSGCRNHCKNCFNQMTWDFNYGKAFTHHVRQDIINSSAPDWINGLTILGGEPFEPENQQALLDFIKEFKSCLPGKTVWCYTGFTYEEITGQSKSRAATAISKALLEQLDVLVDGRYVDELHDISLVFRGSSNQRVIDVKKTFQQNKIVLYIK